VGTAGLLDGLLVLNEGVLLTDPLFEHWLYKRHEEEPFQVLMLDTLFELHATDENSNSEMRVVMQTLKRIRDSLRISIIFSQHLAKPSRDLPRAHRGAVVIEGSADAHFRLVPMAGPATNPRFILTDVGKARGSLVKPLVFGIHQGDDWVRLTEEKDVPIPTAGELSDDAVETPRPPSTSNHGRAGRAQGPVEQKYLP
jgi:hypothetical protein